MKTRQNNLEGGNGGPADGASAERLRAQEAFYKSIIEGAADVTTLVEPDGKILYASASIANEQTSLGYDPQELIGRNTLYLIHPDDQPAVVQAMINDLAGKPTTVEGRARKRDGSWMWVEMRGKAIVGLDGKQVVVAYSRNIDDRKRLQEQLKKSEEYYKSLLQGSSDVIVVTDRQGILRFVSDSVQRILGREPDEVLGKQVLSFVHPDDLAMASQRLSTTTEAASPLVELRLRRRDGTWCACEETGRVIKGPGGEPLVLINVRDITERKRLDREHALLAAIVETSDDAISSVGPDRHITYWNPGAEKMFGYTAAEAIGQPVTICVPLDHRTHLQEVVDTLIKHPDRVVRFEAPGLRKDGTLVEASTVFVAIRDREGKVVGVSAIQRDITERKRAERQVASLAAIVNGSQDAIMIVSKEGTIRFWNPAAERVYGHTAAEAIGRGLELFVPPEDLEQTIAVTRRVVETRQPFSFEQRARNAEGNWFISAVNIFPMPEPKGPATSVGSIGRDITALKETQRELVAAREAALTASQAKSEFLSSMSHEIRTPMTAILGMAELLAEDELNPEQRRYIEILGNNGRELLDLINSILDLAKIESGRLTLEQVAFDLNEVVVKAAQTLAIRAHAEGLELIVSIAHDVPAALLGDPLRLRQVLINLIGNAIKFTERGEVLIAVERDSAPHERLRLKFSVRDTGIGIAKDKLPLLFAAFSQADSSTARKYGGSGLGLAIVKRLVTLMQGEVTLESELGKGSTFSFTSPFEAQADAPAAALPLPDLARVPVLIVDGNRTERSVLGQMLAWWGASVTEVASYEDGLSAIEQPGRPELPARLVMLDERVAARDGESIEQLLAAASRCGASLIAMVHCDNLAADISRLKSLRLANYLIKPIDVRELAKAVRHALTRDAGEAPPQHDRIVATVADEPLIVDRPLKILFADDSVDNRTLVRAFLKKTPYHLEEVGDGRKAIDGFIAAGDYDLVLMDIQMPEVDGYAATRAIRAWEREHNHTHTPIVALTASVFPAAVRLAREAGCDGHLPKPISKKTLLQAIYDAVQAPAPGPRAALT